MIRKFALTACLAALTFAAPVLAQTKPGVQAPSSSAKAAPAAPAAGSEEWLRQRGEAYHSAPESAQNPAEVAETGRLNAEITARNEAAAALEAEQQAEHARAEARYRQDVEEADAARRQWEADKAASDAAQAEWQRSREVWENMVRACERSGRRDCRPAG